MLVPGQAFDNRALLMGQPAARIGERVRLVCWHYIGGSVTGSEVSACRHTSPAPPPGQCPRRGFAVSGGWA